MTKRTTKGDSSGFFSIVLSFNDFRKGAPKQPEVSVGSEEVFHLIWFLLRVENVVPIPIRGEDASLNLISFVINDNNRDQRKKDSKKTSTATIVEIKIEANVVEKASALVAAIDHGDHMTFDSRQVSTLRPSSQKIVSTTNGNTTTVIGEGSLTLTDTLNLDSILVVPSLDYNLLMTWLCLMKTKDEVNLLFQNFHKVIETQYNAKVVRASLIAAKTPISYWGEAITSAAYLINRGEYHKEIQTLDYDYHISEEDESGQSELVNQEVAIPNSVQEALADPRWKAVMNEEMKSLQKNETWELVECLPRKKPVGCRWIYTVKYKADAKINTVRVLLSLAANLDWPLQQFDVKNVFLHGKLSEEQSPRAWFGRFTKSMRAFGYRQSNSYHTLFLKKQHGKITALIVYVDDMVVTGNDPEERKTLQNYLSREFEMKDLGKIPETCGEINVLSSYKTKSCLCIECSESIHHNPGEQHMNAVMRILRYLKNALRKGILFAKNVDHQSIEVYTDVDWAGAVDDRRSTSGYFTFVGGNLVTWKSKKQNVVARSSAEAEFRGMALGLCEALWLRLLLQDLGYLSRQPIRLFCDNKVACDIAHNPVQHDRTKHVEVDRFFIKESWMIRLWNCLRFDQKINWPISLPKLSQVKCSQNF
ncbi:Copia protein [Vitis vinifera]|uniref:Copia protein n=1 Tax=Vitis vinifera TaxID=29760 RepID=A0A438FVU7_VITVI|nr:Copia protein [Vitis vinifera]